MLLPALRRLIVFVSVCLALAFALLLLHNLVEPTGAPNAVGGIGVALAGVALLLGWRSIVVSDDYLTPQHARIFLFATAGLTLVVAGGLLALFYFGHGYPTSFLIFFGAAPMVFALVYVGIAGVRAQEVGPLPQEYRQVPNTGFWGGALPVLAAFPPLLLALGLLAFSIARIQNVFQDNPPAPEQVGNDLRVPEEESVQGADAVLEAAKRAKAAGRYQVSHRLFTQAAAMGISEAHYELAVIYSGDGFLRDLPTAIDHLDTAAQGGHGEAAFLLGRAYRMGELGLDVDLEKAHTYILKAAEQGHVVAQRMLGSMYAQGHGTKVELDKAFRWFNQAAENGDAVAQNDVGVFLLEGRGREQNPVEGIRWLEKAADEGVTVAEYNLARYYANGEVVPQDLEQAYLYFQRIAVKGAPIGYRMTGIYLLQGLGVEKNESAAFEWLSKAAATGDAISEFHLASCYLDAVGTERDTGAALALLESAANKNHTDAQLLLATIYREGRLIMQNNPQAALWFTLAAAEGSDEASQAIASLAPSLSESEAADVAEQAAAMRQRMTQ